MTGESAPMETYDVKTDSTVDDDSLGGRIHVEFKPGKHTPKNEDEEYALERLVAVGAATRVKKAKE